MKERALDPGMGQAVGERTYLRPLLIDEPSKTVVRLDPKHAHYQRWTQILANSGVNTLDGDHDPDYDRAPERGVDFRFETWRELSGRVAIGNRSLAAAWRIDDDLEDLVASGVMLPAGRHLQHGDPGQPRRPMMVYTNCSTASSAWARYYLLLNGSGVGRSLDSDLLITDWSKAPAVQCVISEDHPDFQWGGLFMSTREALARFGLDASTRKGVARTVTWHDVDDSREGWAKALETWEMMAYSGQHRDHLLVLDFSLVRPKGAPIRGMQGRPSSGPIPTMTAFHKAAAGLVAGVPRWLNTIYLEHYFAESVLVGGARRAAGIITMAWNDPHVMDFIRIKMPPEYIGLTSIEILEYRAKHGKPTSTPLWTSNHSVAVDGEFWWLNSLKRGDEGYSLPMARHARKVLSSVAETAYSTGSGEPGLIDVSKLNVSGVWK